MCWQVSVILNTEAVFFFFWNQIIIFIPSCKCIISFWLCSYLCIFADRIASATCNTSTWLRSNIYLFFNIFWNTFFYRRLYFISADILKRFCRTFCICFKCTFVNFSFFYRNINITFYLTTFIGFQILIHNSICHRSVVCCF